MGKILTVVIPTYNMELYLEKCLNSLVLDEVSMANLEVLIINDGSKDMSLEIANSFANKYPDTFSVIDKRNGNYGSCINVGIENATGRFFRILDADDYYSSEELKMFLIDLNTCDADLIMTPFRIVGKNSSLIKALSKTISVERLYNTNELNVCDFLLHMHAMTYRTDLLKECKISLSEGVSYSDTEYCFIPLKFVESVAFFNHEIYQYNASRDGQTTSPQSLKRSTSSLDIVSNRLIDYYKDNVVEVSALISSLWIILLKQISLLFYHTTLLLCDPTSMMSEMLANYDRKVREFPELNSYVSQLCEHHLHYVRKWRKTGRFSSSVLCNIHFGVWQVLDPFWLAVLNRFWPSRL